MNGGEGGGRFDAHAKEGIVVQRGFQLGHTVEARFVSERGHRQQAASEERFFVCS